MVDTTRLQPGTPAYAPAGTPAGVVDEVAGTKDEFRVPVHEERLEVDKRSVELDETQVHRTVEEISTAFQSGTIRIPVRGEEAVVSKEAVVTGEVVVQKGRTTERQNVSETVRRERVDVDDDVAEHRRSAAISDRQETSSPEHTVPDRQETGSPEHTGPGLVAGPEKAPGALTRSEAGETVSNAGTDPQTLSGRGDAADGSEGSATGSRTSR